MSKEILKEAIGLTDQEVKIYFTLLNLGPQPASIIAAKINCPRSSVYPALERMIKKRVINFYSKRKIRHFMAVDIEKIEQILKEREIHHSFKAKMIGENRKKLKDFFSVYKNNHSFAHGNKPKVYCYVGFEEIDEFLKRISSSNQDIYLYGIISPEEEPALDLDKGLSLMSSIWASKSKIHAILPKEYKQCLNNSEHKNLILKNSFKFSSFSKFSEMPSCSIVCGDNASFLANENGSIYAISVDNKLLAEQMKDLYQLIYSQL